MSGGSYEYLCNKDASDLASDRYDGEIQRMADRLAGLGYAKDAARETTEVLVMLRQMRVRIDVRLKRLHWVWHAVEWWDSGDFNEDGVRHALAEYRAAPETIETNASQSARLDSVEREIERLNDEVNTLYRGEP